MRSKRALPCMAAAVLVLAAALGVGTTSAGQAPASPPVTKYTLFIYETPEQLALRGDTSPKGAAYWGSFAAYGKALQEAGVLRYGNPLLPAPAARTVTVRGDKRTVSPGPLSSAPEQQQLGGYFVIEVPTLDAALDWAAKAPCSATGSVEVRPVLDVPGM